MLQSWEKQYPGRLDNMFRALQNVVPSHLADRRLFDFAGVEAQPGPVVDGDIAFDDEPVATAAPLPISGLEITAL